MQVHDRLAHDRGDRQRQEGAEEAAQLAAEQQGEDHQQRVDAQRLAEDVRRDDVALELLERVKAMISHTASSGLSLSAATITGGKRADRRPDVRDQLREAEPRAERDGVRLALGEDAERAEDPQHQPGARAHDQAEQELAADVAEHRGLHARRVVVLRRPVAGRHNGAHHRPDALAVDQHVDAQDDDQDERDARLDEPLHARRG